MQRAAPANGCCTGCLPVGLMIASVERLLQRCLIGAAMQIDVTYAAWTCAVLLPVLTPSCAHPCRQVAPGSNLLQQLFSGDGSSTEAGPRIEFGASQAILVPDEAAKAAVRALVGPDAALVLTVHECKGLEFQMVLVYNFFSGTAAAGASAAAEGGAAGEGGSSSGGGGGGGGGGGAWRVLYSYMRQAGLPCQEPGPAFSAARHSGLLSQLKHLYVMATRWVGQSLLPPRSHLCRLLTADYANAPYGSRHHDSSALRLLMLFGPLTCHLDHCLALNFNAYARQRCFLVRHPDASHQHSTP